jgi:hypothetical protein
MIQQGKPTVGDTVTIIRRIVASPGAMIDARSPIDSAIATLVAPPVVTRDGDSVQIAYSLAVWTAGKSDLVLPGAVVVDQRGHVDTLPDAHIPLDVASVLPAARAPNVIPPKSAQPWVQRAERSELPFAVLLPLALVVILTMYWWWRRRGPALPHLSMAPTPSPLTPERLELWLDANESRLALDHLAWMVRERAAFAEWRDRATAIRFATGNDAAVVALVREGWQRLAEDA